MYKPLTIENDKSTLEPFIDTHTFGLHYYKHYLTYLKNLNKLLKKNNYQYQYKAYQLSDHIDEFPKEDTNNILFNLGGVLNHEVYFKSISIENTKPDKKLQKAIEKQFGNIETLLERMKFLALNLKGSGYTFLVVDKDKTLKLMNTKNQDSPYFYGLIPLIALDMWEHAYYINYENKKELYIENFFKIIDFKTANIIYNQII